MRVKYIFTFLIVVSALVFGFQPVKDTDFGWHYRCGKDLLAGHPCLQNDYSYFLPDYKAFNPSFIFDALVGVVYDRAGLLGLSVFNALIITLTGLLIYWLLKGPGWLRLSLTLLVFLTPGPSLVLGLRSQVITFMLFAGILVIFEKSERNLKLLLTLPSLFILWVNTHIGFISGLLLLPGFFLNHFWQDLKIEKEFPGKKLRLVTLTTFLCFIATIINPFGIKVYLEIIRHATSPLSTTIAEWVAPPGWLKLTVVILSLGLLTFLFFRKKLSIGDTVTLLIFTALTYTGIRNLPFFTLLFFYYLTSALPYQELSRTIKLSGKYRQILNVSGGLLITLLFLNKYSPNLSQTYAYDTVWEKYCYQGQVAYPCEFIKKYPNLTGNIYAMYEWGGFLIWQLPHAKVFADGRTPAWVDENGYSTYQVLLAILQNQPGWNEKLAQTKTDYILVSPGTFMDLLLKGKAAEYGWQEDFRDGASVFYIRNNSPQSPNH